MHQPRPHRSSLLRAARRRAGRVPIWSLLPLMVLPLVGLGVGYYLKASGRLVPPGSVGKPTPSAGLGVPVHNQMAPRYTDADGDLVADPPTDPKQRIDPERLSVAVIAGGLIPPEADWQSLADHLSKVVGRPVQLIPVSSLAADRADQLRALRKSLKDALDGE